MTFFRYLCYFALRFRSVKLSVSNALVQSINMQYNFPREVLRASLISLCGL